ncbi:MAG: TM2 domain-containing protein [Candidatus Dormibacteria bacterium]
MATPSGKTRVVAAVLAFILGSFGAHKFYLGETGKGILFLVFCWTGIPGILGIIDFIRLLTMTDADFDAKYA